jgi:hypothetical protein
MDKYCYHGLLWFGQGEDVKIFDANSDRELIEHTLSERIDEIEVPRAELPYDTSSPYYFEGTGQFTAFGGRSYQKTNAGSAYCLCQYNGTSCSPVLLSKDQNCVKENYPSFEHSFEYLGETWWTGGNQYGFSSNYSTAPRYMDISAYGPFSSSSADDYRLPIIQKAIVSLNIIYNENVPIPQS